MRPRLSAVIVLAIASFIAMSCGGGSVSDGTTSPVTPVDTTKPITTVQRASLTVRVSIDPSDAAIAMELGADAVLMNTGIADAQDPVLMAEAMRPKR